MSEEKKNENTNGDAKESIQNLSLELNFVPEWARKPPETNYFSHKPQGDRRQRPDDRGQRSGGRGQKSAPRVQRPGSRDQRSSPKGQRPGARGQGSRERRPERVEIAPVQVRFLPLQRAIMEIARRIKNSGRAHPMMQVAFLYLDNPESCSARVEINKEAKDLTLKQCKICGMIALHEDTLYRHMAKKHMDDFMDKEETQGEIPSGNFSCVAQCGFSGKLIGPPNHHSYSESIQELHKHSYRNMSLESYKSRIKMIHEEDAVEKWKQEYSHRVSYRPKGDETSKPLSQAKAEAYFIRTIAPSQLQETKRATVPVPLCREIDDIGLHLAIKNAWMAEHRFPSSVISALRGAFSSKGLIIFKAGKGRGVTFVTPTALSPIKIEYVVDAIKEVLLYLQEHPGSSRTDLVKELRPDAKPDSEQIKEILSPLCWLIERGHIIEFFDGTLSVPMKKTSKPKKR